MLSFSSGRDLMCVGVYVCLCVCVFVCEIPDVNIHASQSWMTLDNSDGWEISQEQMW